MKNTVGLAITIIIAAGAALAIAQSKQDTMDKEKKPEVITLKGQVVDLACYLQMGALAGDHQQCAEMCVQGGASTGFKTKEHMFLVIDDPMHQKNAPDLSKFVNHDAEISASVFEKDGLRAVKVLSIK